MLGEGILKGLAETAKNFAGSFVVKERLTTVEYPEERCHCRRRRGIFPSSCTTGADWEAGLRCVACQICEKECPPKCIYIEKSKDKKPDFVGKLQIYPAKFDIDISVCMSCQICVEVCPFEAIKMDTEYELATDDRFGGLLLDRQATGEVERVLPQDSSHRSGGSRCAAGGREGQGRGEGKGRCRCRAGEGGRGSAAAKAGCGSSRRASRPRRRASLGSRNAE